MKNTIIKLITIGVFMLSLAGQVQAEQPISNNCDTTSDFQCCVVANSENPQDGDTNLSNYPDSLSLWTTYFNMNQCRDRIAFNIHEVHIYENYVYEADNTSYAFELGNSDIDFEVVFVVHDTVDPTLPVITIKNSRNVTIENLVIRYDTAETAGFHGTFIKVDSSDTVSINNVRIENEPYKPAIEIVDSSNVRIDNLQIPYAYGTSLDSTATELSPVIKVTNGSGFEFTNSTLEGIVGHGIEIENNDGFNVSGFTSVYDLDEGSKSAIGIHITGGQGTLQTIDISNTNGTGIQFSGVTDAVAVTGITLFGHDPNPNSADDTGNDANGMVIEDSSNLSFGSLDIAYFGKNGVLITGASNSNTFSGDGINIYENGKDENHLVDLTTGHGILIEGTSQKNDVRDADIVLNVNCGLYIKSTGGYNSARGNNFSDNNECGIGGENSVANFDAEDLILLRRGENTIFFDYNRDSFNEDLAGFELHVIKNSDEPSGGTTSGVNLNRTTLVKKMRVNSADSGDSGTTNSLTLEGTGSDSSNADRKDEPFDSETSSYIGSYTYDTMPESTKKIEANPESIFFILVYDASDNVIGVANDMRAMTDYADLDGGCYTDQDTGESTRLHDPSADYDLDGLYDYLEDVNYNCITDTDAGETSAYDADTDDDGINDYFEIRYGYNPLSKDSDGDDLDDGEEDKNSDGECDCEEGGTETDPLDDDTDDDDSSDGEEITKRTDPRDPDTDDDGLLDGNPDELCAHIPSSQECYYENCIPSEEFVSGSVSTGGDDSSGEECTDSDDDDICDSLEDADGSCSPTTGEMIVGLDDTDGDGIKDGDEDYNHNGVYEPELSETNPVEEDSDGDCIPDGLEDANANHFVDDTTESDPTLSDTDGDGISDGTEDYNCDGNVDTGETNPNLTDTDGDGLLDSSPNQDFTDSAVTDVYDIAPWKYGPENNYVVRYCGLNGWDDYDYDGDGLSDVSEDFDGDCINDIDEPSPLDTDSDDDGVSDFQEMMCGYGGEGGEGTDPRNPDTDGDGMSDYEEAENTILAGECGTLFQQLGDTWGGKNNSSGCSLSTATNVATSGSNLPIIMLAGVLVLLVVRRMRYFA